MPNPTVPAPLGPEAKSGFLDLVERAVTQGLGDIYDYATDLPGFIADPATPGAQFALVKGVARQTCRRWARGSALVRGPGFDSAWSAICSEYLESIDENPSDGSLELPFEGGQCEKLYQVQGEWRTDSFYVCSTGVTGGVSAYEAFSTEFTVLGPITGFTLTRKTPACGGFDGHFIEANTPSGDYLVFNRDGTGQVRREVSFRITAINPVDGVDNCGNPEPPYLPPQTPPGLPSLPPVSVDLPGIGPVNVDVDFDADGNVVVKIPDLGIEVTSDNPFGPLPALPVGPAPGDQGTAGTPDSATPGSPAEGEAPAGEVLVGLRLDLVSAPVNPNTYSPGVFRGAAYIYMGGPEGLDQDYAGAMLTDGQFVFAEQDNLTKWRVAANIGYSWSVTPYYREVETA